MLKRFGPIELNDFLEQLQQDGLLNQEQVYLVRSKRDAHSKVHPVIMVARENFALPAPKKGIMTQAFLTEWLADFAGLPYFHIDPLKVDVPEVTKVMSFAFAKRYKIIAVDVSEETITIATSEPFIRDWEDDLVHAIKKSIRRVMVNPEDIEQYVVEFYSLSQSVSGASKDDLLRRSATGNFEQLIELGKKKNFDANDQHIVSIVDWLLQYAFAQRASDIHLEPRREEVHVRFRIDGILHKVYDFPVTVGAAVISRLKILGRMDVAEKRRPQDGRIKTRVPDGEEVELRLSTLPTAFGEKMVMRIFDPTVLVKNFRELGFTVADQQRWEEMISRPNGIILVTGPTGSGKTTTLYSTLKVLAKPEVNVCTIEDPIEMVEPAFNQIQVQHETGVTFSSGVKALLRQDPDIVMVGEIRDKDTADMAIQAALTGHLVISTLHTNDASTAVTRLLDIGVPYYLIKATLIGVVAQRLVRVLCPHCKEQSDVDDKMWAELLKPRRAAAPKHMFSPKGCLECRNTGYLGRQGIYEMLTFSEGVRKNIVASADIQSIRDVAIKEGMHLLRWSGAQKVMAGMTTIEEVMRVTPAPDFD